MSEKVKLPKEVCNALDIVKAKDLSNVEIYRMSTEKAWSASQLTILNLVTLDLLMRALVLGYEPEMTKSEQLEDLYWNSIYQKGEYEEDVHQQAMRDTLKILGIHYDWMEDAE